MGHGDGVEVDDPEVVFGDDLGVFFGVDYGFALGVLEVEPLTDGPEVVSEVEGSGGLDPREDSSGFGFHFGCLSDDSEGEGMGKGDREYDNK